MEVKVLPEKISGTFGEVDRDSAWRFYKAQYFVPMARAVVLNNGFRVLLVRRKDDLEWGLPKGLMLPGESAQECAERMISVQTGLTVTKIQPFVVDSGKYNRVPGKPSAQAIIFSFRVLDWDGELQTNNDHIMDAQWFWPRETRDILGIYNDDLTAIEEHTCTDIDADVHAEGNLVWVR